MGEIWILNNHSLGHSMATCNSATCPCYNCAGNTERKPFVCVGVTNIPASPPAPPPAPPIYTNWGGGEPNDYGDGEDCGALWDGPHAGIEGARRCFLGGVQGKCVSSFYPSRPHPSVL